MAKKKIINVYLSFPFVGRTKKNIEATMYQAQIRAEKWLREDIGVPRDTEIKYVSLYDSYDIIKRLHFRGRKRNKAIIDMINELEFHCDYFIKFDDSVSRRLLYGTGVLSRPLKSYEYDFCYCEYQVWAAQSDIPLDSIEEFKRHYHRIDFNDSTAVLVTFPELNKLNRQYIIRCIRHYPLPPIQTKE